MDWKEVIRGVAPTVASVLLTPAAGMAVKVLADKVLGGSTGNAAQDEAKLADALAGGVTPEVRIALIQAEAEVQMHASELRKLLVQQETDVYRLEVTDRHSARDASVRGDTSMHVFWLTVLIFITVIGIEAAVLMRGVPLGLDGQMAGRVLGTLDAALLAALYYTYGSSGGSARKTELTKGAL